VGYTLDEIRNDITRETPASFEPTIDYVVVKVPRFTFEKFPQAKDLLTPQMKSVGEAMAIGRTFQESLQKAIRSLETGSFGFEREHDAISREIAEEARLLPAVREAGEETILIADGFSCKTQIEELSERRALHTAQVIAMALDHGPHGVIGPHPEEAYPDLVQNGDGRLREAALVGGAVAVSAAGMGAATRRLARRR